MTHIIGNDQTYLNAFTFKNPTVFAGFRSFDDMVDFIEATPGHIKSERVDNRNTAWQTSESKTEFTKSRNMEQAIRIARKGWPEGAAMVRRIAPLIATEHAVNRKRAFNVAGGRANVARMLAGNPRHMISRPKRDGRKIVSLFVELTASAAIDAENLMVRAATVTAICDVLEQQDYSCNIVAVESSQSANGKSCQIAVEIKSAGEALNIDNVAFTLGHPSMLRRFCFGLTAHSEALRTFWYGMGRPIDTLEDGDEPQDSYYFKKLDMSDQHKVRGKTVEERARSLIPLILPYNLEIIS